MNAQGNNSGLASMESELKSVLTTEKQLMNELQSGIAQFDQMTALANQTNADRLKNLIVQQLIEIEKAEFLANVMKGLDKYRNILREEIAELLKERKLIEVSENENRISEIAKPTETEVPSISDASPRTSKTGAVEFERVENQIDNFEWDISTELEIQNELKRHEMPSTQEVVAAEVEKSNAKEQITSDWEMIKEYYNLQDDTSDDDIEIVEIAKTAVGSTGASKTGTISGATGERATPTISNAKRAKGKFVRKTTTHCSEKMVDRYGKNVSKRPKLQTFEKSASFSAPIDDSEKLEREKKLNFTFKKKTASGLKNLPLFTQ